MTTSQRKLQALLGFTETDLNANRRGRLSAAQVQALRQSTVNELKALLAIPFILALGVLLFLDLTLAIPALMVLGALAAGLYELHREHLKTFKDKKVRKLSGYLSKNPLNTSVPYYMISIGGEQLPVDRRLYEHLPEGQFAVYILRDARQILCMEPLGKANAPKTPVTAVKKSTIKRSKPAAAKKPSTAKHARSTAKAKAKPAAKRPQSGGTVKARSAEKQARPAGVVRVQPGDFLRRTRTPATSPARQLPGR
jgi:hypothetical protein